ncbi:LuxR C-terminal-related transcriptional regulator [Kitasatospora albolonga]|uniref:LuxR C-terminal-related transcriptional regulator n=1 Tax=Kitasatospora albolonga TaxID=68173 RepID=UPI0035E5C415
MPDSRSGVRNADGRGCARSARERPTPPGTSTLLLGDEHPLIRRGIRAVLDGDPSFRVLGEAADGHALLGLAHRHRPDVVLLDAALPGPDVLDTVHHLAGSSPRGTAVALLVPDHGLTDDWTLNAARAGARAFLPKYQSPGQLLSAVKGIARGNTVIGTRTVDQLLTALRRTYRPVPTPPQADISQLTPRERQVFDLIAQGLTNQQISHALTLTEGTVKSHFNRICHKLALRNRVDAVILAYESGLGTAATGVGAGPGDRARPRAAAAGARPARGPVTPSR